MESALTNTGTMNLELSDSEMALLKDIASDGQTNFVSLKKEGLQIGQEFHPEIFVQVTEIDRYSYIWEGGTNKIINRDMARDEAKAAGYAEGMNLSLKILKPEMGEEYNPFHASVKRLEFQQICGVPPVKECPPEGRCHQDPYYLEAVQKRESGCCGDF